MTEPMVDDALVEVTQIDIDAAKAIVGLPADRAHITGDPVVQALARHRLAGVAAGREEACQAIEHRIAEGYDAPANRTDQCAHGKFGWEDCIACYDNTLEGEIAAIRQRGV